MLGFRKHMKRDSRWRFSQIRKERPSERTSRTRIWQDTREIATRHINKENPEEMMIKEESS